MSENLNDSQNEGEERDDTPLGAIFVTTTLAVIILVLWFSMYLLNILRS